MNDFSYEDRLQKFFEIIKNSDKICFFGGAGVSTGSGIPDFRSKNGLYNDVDVEFSQYSPEYYLSSACLNHNPKIFYNFYRKKMDARNYEPNMVHKVLAKLEEQGKMTGVVTQNIDMLHEKAGTKKLFKIHGTIGENHCIVCGKTYGIDYIFDDTNAIPRCETGKSNHFVRPNVVLYGEQLPNKDVKGAIEAIENANCLIICGTSLTVEPAASMVNYFANNCNDEKTHLIIINRDETTQDKFADIVFHEDMNEIFLELFEKI